ncbi:molecular chaperone [Spirochaetia bacterium]|nr:molecular chaperone [Spirochaetia bacterium]
MAAIADVKRSEIKYRIPLSLALRMQGRLAAILPPDKNNRGSGGYMVRSLYFDSLNNGDFRAKIDGMEEHKKLRLRIYAPGSKTAKLELKEKTGVWQRKRSITLSREDALLLIAGDYSPLLRSAEHLSQKIYLLMSQGIYRPKCIIQYQRTAFIGTANDIRITFDSKIEASESNYDLFAEKPSLYPVSHPNSVTMEVKYDRFLLSYVKNLLENADQPSVSYSKYTMGRYISHYLG